MIDWAPDTFKLLIGAAALWFLKQMKNKATPIYKAIKNLSEVVNRVEIIEDELFILDEKVKAKISTDPNPLFILNNLGELIYANSAYGEMGGFAKIEDAHGKGYLMAIPKEDVEEIENLSDRHLRHPSSFEGKIKYKNRKTGDIINTICRTELIRDKKGKWILTIGRLLIIK